MANELITNLWTSEAVPGSVLLTLCLDRFGTELFDWQPETLSSEIESEFGVTAPQVSLDKLHALIISINTDQFYNSPSFFSAACSVLGGSQEHNFDFMQPPTCLGAFLTITEVFLNDPPTEKPEKLFTPDVRRYMGCILANDGFTKGFGVLSIASFDKDVFKHIEDKLSSSEQANASNEIANYTKQWIRKLILLMDSLPLKHRDMKSWLEFKDRVAKTLKIDLVLDDTH